MFVVTAPGKTTVTRTFVPAQSEWRPSVSSFAAAFEAPSTV
jgi:hypothetical protein